MAKARASWRSSDFVDLPPADAMQSVRLYAHGFRQVGMQGGDLENMQRLLWYFSIYNHIYR